MSIDKLSNVDSNYIFEHILNSKQLSDSSKNTLSQASGGTKDVLDAANDLLAKSGQSLDAFDTDHSGSLDDSEKDALIAALVALLANPDNAKQFLDSLSHQSSTVAPKVSSPAPASSTPSTPPAASSSDKTTPASAAQSGEQTKQGGTAAPVATGGSAQGGASQTSEFGREKQVDPTKNFDSVPGGGYTVKDCADDIMKLAANDKKETGPQPTREQAEKLAQGIINGTNNYFDKTSNPKATAQALVASAWKESKFNFGAQNGGVFQCAENRFNDYKKAHPDSSITFSQMSTSGDPSASIDVALWAMAHPAPGMGAPSGVSAPMPADGSPQKALYLWNYNNRPMNDGTGNTELDEYMQKTKYFEGLLA